MTERVAAALRKHRHLRSSRVLCLDDGKPITRQGAWSRVRYAAHKANVPTGVHILRHTFCSHLVMRGAAMRAVQELVGHQDLTMTQRYSHLSPAPLVDTIRLLESRVAEPRRGEILETAKRPLANGRLSRASRRRATAGRQGFENGETCFSNLVMARDFWF